MREVLGELREALDNFDQLTQAYQQLLSTEA